MYLCLSLRLIASLHQGLLLGIRTFLAFWPGRRCDPVGFLSAEFVTLFLGMRLHTRQVVTPGAQITELTSLAASSASGTEFAAAATVACSSVI